MNAALMRHAATGTPHTVQSNDKQRSASGRPQTPHDFNLLRSIERVDLTDSPPIPAPASTPQSTVYTRQSSAVEQSPSLYHRSGVSTSPQSVKRDSGLAHSDVDRGRGLYGRSEADATTDKPTLPAIVVQHAPISRPSSRSSRKSSRNTLKKRRQVTGICQRWA